MSVRLMACLFVVVFGAIATPALAVEPVGFEPPELMVAYNLCGRFLAPNGWGFDCGTVTYPGPPLTAAQGDEVALTLYSADGPLYAHQWLLDLNGDGFASPGEPVSGLISSPTTPTFFSFTLSATPGPYSYICAVHGALYQRGDFVVTAGTRPTITVTNPDGTATNRWTGGRPKTLTWTVTDPNDPVASLTVYLNYSYNAGANTGTIAGPLTGDVTSVVWNVPLINATDVHVLATVIDPSGGRGNDDNLVPIIDSAAPTVTTVSPPNGATDVDPGTWINITFSEAMNQASAEGATSLCAQPGCTNVPLTVVRWTGNVLTVRPAARLAGSRDYQGTVSVAAQDVSDPGNPMVSAFVWSFRTANNPPSVTVSQPTASSRWTGGSTHTLQWSASDLDEPAAALRVWVNYSSTGLAPFSPIAGLQGVGGDVASFAWTVPGDDTTTARLEFTVVDSAGAKTVTLSPAFAIDSTPPTVTSTNPANGATGVVLNANIVVTFSEPMNTTATGTPTVVGLQAVASGGWIALTFAWDAAATQLTADPVPTLAASTDYRLFVNASAVDASDPGRTMATAFSATFTTGTAADTTPPVIANATATPPTQVAGGPVELSATVTDNTGLSSVSANVTLPDSTTTNRTMTAGPGNRYAFTATWTQVGVHGFVIWAIDSSGNAVSVSGSFAIRSAADTTPPAITNAAANPPSQTAGGSVTLSATVMDDSGVASVSVNVTRPDQTTTNQTMTAGPANRYAYTATWTQVGIHSFVVWANDTTGNAASASGSFTITAADTTPPTVAHTQPGGPFVTGSPIRIEATVSDNAQVARVNLVYTDVGGTERNVTMTLEGTVYVFTIPAQTRAGTVRYRIYAEDAAGNSFVTGEFAVTVQETPSSLVPLIASAVLIVIAAVTAVALLLRKRRKRGGEPPPVSKKP